MTLEDQIKLKQQLLGYLDGLTITSGNIGEIRARCLMPFHCEWNAWVRDETAARENKRPIEVGLPASEEIRLLKSRCDHFAERIRQLESANQSRYATGEAAEESIDELRQQVITLQAAVSALQSKVNILDFRVPATKSYLGDPPNSCGAISGICASGTSSDECPF